MLRKVYQQKKPDIVRTNFIMHGEVRLTTRDEAKVSVNEHVSNI